MSLAGQTEWFTSVTEKTKIYQYNNSPKAFRAWMEHTATPNILCRFGTFWLLFMSGNVVECGGKWWNVVKYVETICNMLECESVAECGE